MTIDEAIEVLKTFHDQAACTLDATSANAFELGIEALKRIQKLRGYSMTQVDTRLPGETKDQERGVRYVRDG